MTLQEALAAISENEWTQDGNCWTVAGDDTESIPGWTLWTGYGYRLVFSIGSYEQQAECDRVETLPALAAALCAAEKTFSLAMAGK